MKTTKLATTKNLITLSLIASSVQLQAEQLNELETITVTATRSEQAIDTSLAAVTIIDRAEIEAIQPLSTLELLSRVAGLDISQQGGRGQSSSIFSRGTNSNHTLVLVDGIRISSATLGTADVQSIAPAQIDRIEIVKGPRAAIWGSDAIGGVINIFTRKEQGVKAEINFGSESYKQASATVGFQHGDGSSSITISKEKADGFDVLEEAQDDEDGFEHKSVTASGEQKISDALTLNYLLQANESDNEYDNKWLGNDQVKAKNYALFIGANYQWSATDEVAVKLGKNRDSRLNYGVSDSLFETVREQLSVVNHSTLDESTALTYGLDYNQESIETTVTEFNPAYNETERKLIGAFVYGQKSVEQFTFEGALRYDDVEDIDSEITYNLGAGYDLTENTVIALNHSSGFKAPSFNDLYSPYGGHTGISSESSKTTEVLLKHQFTNASLGLSVYKTNVDNLIDWREVTPGSFNYAPINIDEADIQGAEFELNAVFAGLTHDLSIAYIDTEDANTGKQLIRRARDHFSYSVSAQMGEIDFSLSYNYKGKRMDQNEVELDGYSLVNLKLGYAISDALKLNFKVNNLFDESYSTVNGYNTQGEAFYFGLSYQL